MSFSSGSDVHCRKALANFFQALERARRPLSARWLRIIDGKQSGNNNCTKIPDLSRLLGMDYEMYLPFMLQCGLVRMGRKNQPIVSIAKSKKNGSYIWDEFIAEYKLNLEISHVYLNGKQQVYFIRVGQFSAVPFSILEQLKMQKTFGYSCIRHQQMKLVKSLAGISISLLAIPSVEIELAGMEKSTTGPSSSSSFNFNVTDTAEVSIVDESEVENFKSLLQLHLFDRICKNGVDSSSLWKVIDTSKLKEGLHNLISEVQKARNKEQTEKLRSIGCNLGHVQLKENMDYSYFPVLQHYGIPLEKHSISSVLRDVIKLSKSAINSDLLTFDYYNDTKCSLVQVPVSSSYEGFRRTENSIKWVKKILLAVGAEDVNVAAEWLLQHLAECYNESFVNAASSVGLLLHSKKMDAEAACAMWEEANVGLRSQRIILRHLANFFGRRITVPESFVRELERGSLQPISGSVDVDGVGITFWYKKIDEAVVHRMKTEMDYRGREFFMHNGYNSADIIFGGDHGARRFRAVLRLILRNTNNNDVVPLSVVITIANIDCDKENRAILENTIAKPINDGLRRLFQKKISLHFNEAVNIATISNEIGGNNNNDFLSLNTRTFIAGDLAFFSLILGKENRSIKWCNWCMLSPKEWAIDGHEKGEKWTIEKIYEIQNNVAGNNLAETPQNIRGCTAEPLIDCIPIENFILSILHIIIGIGNSLIECLFEWVEERIEVLPPNVVEARNRVLYATLKHSSINEDYKSWLENGGILLTDIQMKKKQMKGLLDERVRNHMVPS